MGNNTVKETPKNKQHVDYFEKLREMFQLKDKTWRMHVRPYTKAGVDDLHMLMNNAYACERISITEKNGTFCITSLQPIRNPGDYIHSLWGMLHRKYNRQCNELASEDPVDMSGFKTPRKWKDNDLGLPVAEADGEKNFYVFIISPEFIEATTLPRFRMAG